MANTERMKSSLGAAVAGVGIFLAVIGTIVTFVGTGTSIALGAFGIVFGIAGYTLGARRLGLAAIVICTVALFFGLAVSQGLVPGMEGFMPRETEIGPT
ncbi:MAG: hypothetical protein ACRDSJ_21730 [Rubrobacteraceae bacterium]